MKDEGRQVLATALEDQFAMAALPAVIEKYTVDNQVNQTLTSSDIENITEISYEIARSMIQKSSERRKSRYGTKKN